MKKTVQIVSLSVVLLMVFSIQGWSQSAPAEALKNVTIHTADGNTIQDGTIVWRDGVITDVGDNINVPFDAYVYDGGDSLHVYPGFIDGLAQWGSPDVEENVSTPEVPGDPAYDRAGIQPQRSPSDLIQDDKIFTEAAKMGFTAANLGLKGQMLPGQTDLFLISEESTADNLLHGGIGIFAQFEEAQGQAYPSTTMGVMNQFRQLFNDAKALQQHEQYFASLSSNYPAPKKDKVLEALFPVMDNEQPFYFVVDTEENIERVFWLQDDLGFDVVIVSGKEAYKQADALKERDIPVLASVDLPEEPEWQKADEDKDQPEVTEEMRIFRDKQLEAYKADIENISKLINSGVQVGYASNGLELKDITKNLKTLQEEGGLSDTETLQLMTQSTANILGYGEKLGDIKSGRLANFTVFTEPFMDEESKAVYSVSNGSVTEFESESSGE
ncbi:amidohydrolase family protein [Fodinibius sp. Rm-B-1B1-1]|uniref:amidohydrolase family protein n=1 Tax=Fodinibius alkaliphilus TaxID=3140241 RepID=UPI003159E6BB